MCDDTFFVASCICDAISNEIRWLDVEERRILGAQLPQFQGCIGFIDGTLIKIRRPKIDDHRVFFNDWKKIYSLNNIIVVDHNGLFIHMDLGFPGSYHDVNILCSSYFHRNWRHDFVHTNAYFEYLFGDPRYIGEKQYIMCRIGTREIAANADLSIMLAYDKLR